MTLKSSTSPLAIRQRHLALRAHATAIVVSLTYEAQHQFTNMSEVRAFSKKLPEKLGKEISLLGVALDTAKGTKNSNQ